MTCSDAPRRNWFARYESLVFPLGVALVARLLISLFGIWVAVTFPSRPYVDDLYQGVTPLSPNGWNVVVAPFQRWDVLWYELIATRGYAATDSSTVYFPLYPLLMRVLAPKPSAVMAVGTLISTFATAATFTIFYNMTRKRFGQQAARLGLVTWAAFPTAFFLFIPYAEALFVLLALVAFQAAQREKWVWAGIVGGLAALTRSPGVWLVVPLSVEWFVQARRLNWKRRVQTGLCLLLIPFGLGLYALYLQITLGDGALWVKTLAPWGNVFSLPWDTLAFTLREILFGSPSTLLNNLLDLGITCFVLVLSMRGLLPRAWHSVSWRGWQPVLPISYGVYALLFTLVPLTLISHIDAPIVVPMASAARRAIVIFPAFMMAGLIFQGRWRAPLTVAFLIALQAVSIFIFVRWLWLA